MGEPKLRFAVVGLGHFAQVAVMPAIARQSRARLTALVSGDAEKLAVLGDRYGVEHRVSYDDYDALLESGNVDAVYLATPNDTHADFCIRAAERGVHVLCEKPMAPTSAECEAMISVCDEHDVRLMIGYRLHFEAANLTAIEALEHGEIGDVRFFNSVFTLQVRPGNVRIQNRPGAGPLYDIGIYCINAARYLFRDEPTEVCATMAASADPRFSHSEEMVAATLRFPGGRLANFVASFGAASSEQYQVFGTEGIMRTDSIYEYAKDIELSIERSGEVRRHVFKKRDQIAGELEHFISCVEQGTSPEPSGLEGLLDVRAIEAIRKSATEGRTVAIPPAPAHERPSLALARYVPHQSAPRTLLVKSGSVD